MVTICTTKFNIEKFYVLLTECMYVFCVDVTQRLLPCTERERERGGDVVRGTSYTQVWGKGDIASLC